MAMIYCNECGKEISDKADKCPHCGCPVNFGKKENTLEKQEKSNNGKIGLIGFIISLLGLIFSAGGFLLVGLTAIVMGIVSLAKKENKKWMAIAAIIISIAGFALSPSDSEKERSERPATQTESNSNNENIVPEANAKNESTDKSEGQEEKGATKDKYNVGETWENKTLKVIYTNAYEFTDYNQYNAPTDGNKIICAEFEFENTGNSDTTVMYTDFDGYADGYEVEQSYAPEGTGLDFSVSMSAGRKGTGKIAFEVPEDAKEIEIEFSPNMFSSEKVIFVYK